MMIQNDNISHSLLWKDLAGSPLLQSPFPSFACLVMPIISSFQTRWGQGAAWGVLSGPVMLWGD